MNAIELLVLVSLFGQLGPGGQPSPSAPSAASGPSIALNQAIVQDNARDFGWQISSEDGALEYIVQISPEEALTLQSNHWENPSDLPPELVGRATRILVRIGNEVLPREPSLAVIDATMKRYNSAADLSAALDPGRVSTVESEAMRNVQNGSAATGGLPALPYSNNSGAGNLSLPNPLGDLSNQALGGVNSTTGQRDVATPLPSTAQGNTKFNNTAPAANAETGRLGSTPPTGSANGFPSESDRLGTTGWQDAGNRRLPDYPPGTTAAPERNSYNTDPQSLNHSYGTGIAQRGQMPGRNLSDSIGQGQNGYGSNDPRGGYPRDGYSDGYAGNPNGYAGNPNAGDGYRFPDGQGQYRQGNAADTFDQSASPPLLASRPTNPAPPNDAQPTPKEVTGSASDASSPAAAPKPKSNENFLNVFFVLSLVVNFYLAMLIRKLLTRYRSLLSSVRSQTA